MKRNGELSGRYLQASDQDEQEKERGRQDHEGQPESRISSTEHQKQLLRELLQEEYMLLLELIRCRAENKRIRDDTLVSARLSQAAAEIEDGLAMVELIEARNEVQRRLQNLPPVTIGNVFNREQELLQQRAFQQQTNLLHVLETVNGATSFPPPAETSDCGYVAPSKLSQADHAHVPTAPGHPEDNSTEGIEAKNLSENAKHHGNSSKTRTTESDCAGEKPHTLRRSPRLKRTVASDVSDLDRKPPTKKPKK